MVAHDAAAVSPDKLLVCIDADNSLAVHQHCALCLSRAGQRPQRFRGQHGPAVGDQHCLLLWRELDSPLPPAVDLAWAEPRVRHIVCEVGVAQAVDGARRADVQALAVDEERDSRLLL